MHFNNNKYYCIIIYYVYINYSNPIGYTYTDI